MSKFGQLWLFNNMYGFNSIPSGSDFETVGKAVLVCAKGDGVLASEERDWLVNYFAALGAPTSVTDELSKYEANDDLATLMSRATQKAQSAKRDIVWMAIKASAADSDYGPQEQKKVHHMAELLDVSSDIVTQLEQLHVEEENIRNKRISLLYPEGTPY